MTREEALTIINHIDRNILTNEECYVVDNIFELVAPSLSTNLDEAAEEYRDTEVCTDSDYIDDDGDSLYRSFALKEAFKAGVEWMAGQGIIIECNVDDDGLRWWLGKDDAVELGIMSCPPEIKVIVQIRKKQ